jgi:predicted dehydrogenase
MVEKPVALTLGDLDDMIAATRSTSLLAGQTVRFQPAVAEMRTQLAAGVIGRPRLIHIQWYVGHVWPNGWRAWQLDPSLSGGHPVHNGTHAFDLVAWLTGRRAVRVFTRSFSGAAAQMPVPDSFQTTIRMDDGTLALVELSYALRRPGDLLRRLSVIGETGTLMHSTEDDMGLSSDLGRAVPASVEGAFDRQTAHWLDVIRGRAQPTTAPTQMRTALALGLAAQRSLTCNEAVVLDPGQSGDGE